MGAFLDKPKTEKYNESNVGGGLKYGLSSMQGWRIEMEDAHSAVIGIPDQKENVSWFAVFDGHAGSRVSAHCSHHLLDCIRYPTSASASASTSTSTLVVAGPQITSPAVCSRNKLSPRTS